MEHEARISSLNYLCLVRGQYLMCLIFFFVTYANRQTNIRPT